jgi:DNA replication protein DnaC
LPTVTKLEAFDFGFAAGAPRPLVREPAAHAFIERAEKVVLRGASAVGKTRLAIALGLGAAGVPAKTRFIAAADLMLQLQAARDVSGFARTLHASQRTGNPPE